MTGSKLSDNQKLNEAREKLAWKDGTTKQSPRTPRGRPWRVENEKENPTKSTGVAPSSFHRKRSSERKSDPTEQLKQTIESNLLTQERQAFQTQQEEKRKSFRQITALKTWPLQDMAMEHLDYLLDGNRMSQFHGGDYPSSESTSSTASAQGKRRQMTISTLPVSPSSPQEDLEWGDEPLWSREPRIFATEKAQGKRKYLVGHFGRVADWYWRKSVNKHLYEVIREQTPCRMYFDLEYAKQYNPNVDEGALLDEFQEELAAELLQTYNVPLQTRDIIDLDSSTDAKFSRHWMLDLDDHGLFQDAPTVGRFIKKLVGRLAEELATDQLSSRRPTLAKHLFVQTKDKGKTSCFIDLGVYTRNRLFRCFASSKFGKTNTLVVADRNQYPLNLPTKESQPNPKASMTMEDYVQANNWEPHARVLASTLVVPLHGAKGKRIFKVQGQEHSVSGVGNSKSSPRAYHPAVPMRTTKTPFPSLDRFVLDVLANRGGVTGAIRAWSMEYSGTRGDVPVSVTYQLSRNRYCEFIGRAHKSNNIFWTVVFEGWYCLQGCHDPDCRGRGSPVAIPDDKLDQVQAEFEAWTEEEFNKALLSLTLDDSTVKETKEEDSSTLLSDEALLDAIQSNPALFP